MAVVSRPSRRSKKSRATSSWPVPVFLLLSQGVLSTLQCSSSASHSRSQSQISIINVPREGHVTSNSLSGEVLSSSEPVEVMDPQEQSKDSLYFRSTRDSATGGGQEFVHLCGDRLRYALKELCNRRFHDPSKTRDQSRTRKRSIVLRRLPRTVVNECCQRSCNATHLLKYCKDANGPHLQERDSQSDVNPSSVEIPEGQGVHNTSRRPGAAADEVNESHPQEQEIRNNSNAVISPLPRKLIPLASLINDYRIQPEPNIEY